MPREQQFVGISTDCVSCHLKDFSASTTVDHRAAGFAQNCILCHNTSTWTPAKFDHGQTRFALTGTHVTATCAQCHVNNKYAGTPSDCASCHMVDFNKATTPNHVAAGFPLNCTLCHTTTRWLGAKFDHTSQTKFPLTGAHMTTTCGQCHKNNQYATLATACISCHQADYNATAAKGGSIPNHAAAGFPTTCDTCHSTINWTSATFNHTTQTKFPLTGTHVNVACGQCHTNNQYATLPATCVSCHQADYNSTATLGGGIPNHAAAGFPTTCDTCHSTANWLNATFDHSKFRFTLTGAHVNLTCTQCHSSGQYATMPTNCDSCHLAKYNATTNPTHSAAGFATKCDTCHSMSNWLNAAFDHSKFKFPLTGLHVNVACGTCHTNNQYATLPTNCDSCHLASYNSTATMGGAIPNHVAAGFPKDCSLCHSTTNWTSATFSHNPPNTKFALTGLHVNVACGTCHTNNQYATLPTNCDSCHLASYNSTAAMGGAIPNHVAAGFPKDCSLCHSTTNWTSSTFNHAADPKFALTGAHTTVACASCHINGNYTTTPTDCYSCHTTEYNTATDPGHKAAGFPTTCASCHTIVAGWVGAKYIAHDTASPGFPIYSGHHNGQWTACSICHTSSANYATFNCTGTCHQHDSANVTPHHTGVKNFVYSPTSCYGCHPKGSAG